MLGIRFGGQAGELETEVKAIDGIAGCAHSSIMP
jgi:hypothetical protein